MGPRALCTAGLIGLVACGGDFRAEGPGARGKAESDTALGGWSIVAVAGSSADDFYLALGALKTNSGHVYHYLDRRPRKVGEADIGISGLWVGELAKKQTVLVIGKHGRRAWVEGAAAELKDKPLLKRTEKLWKAGGRLWTGTSNGALHVCKDLDACRELRCPGNLSFTTLGAVGDEVYAARLDGTLLQLDATNARCEKLKAPSDGALYGIGDNDKTMVVAGHDGLWRQVGDGDWLQLNRKSMIEMATTEQTVVVGGIGLGLATFVIGKKTDKDLLEPDYPEIEIADDEPISGENLTVLGLWNSGSSAVIAHVSPTGSERDLLLLSEDGASWDELPLPRVAQ